jgi:hypothetical protein
MGKHLEAKERMYEQERDFRNQKKSPPIGRHL